MTAVTFRQTLPEYAAPSISYFPKSNLKKVALAVGIVVTGVFLGLILFSFYCAYVYHVKKRSSLSERISPVSALVIPEVTVKEAIDSAIEATQITLEAEKVAAAKEETIQAAAEEAHNLARLAKWAAKAAAEASKTGIPAIRIGKALAAAAILIPFACQFKEETPAAQLADAAATGILADATTEEKTLEGEEKLLEKLVVVAAQAAVQLAAEAKTKAMAIIASCSQ